jgi:putative transposase
MSRTDLPPSIESALDLRIGATSWRGRTTAKERRHTPEPIIRKPREAEVKLAEGTAIAQVCKELAITGSTCYRWRKEHGGPKPDRARRLEDLENKYARLKQLLADAKLDKAILKRAAHGKS